MRTTILLLVVASLAGAARAEEVTDAVRRLTLVDAYGLADQHSETVGIREAEWQAAEARYRQQTGQLWPELSARGSATLTHSGGKDDDVYHAGLGGTYTIFNGFRTARLAAAQKAEGEALQEDTARTRQLLFQDVADAFYQELAVQGERAAVQEQIDTLTQRVDVLEQRVALGKSTRGELLTAKTQVADAQVSAAELDGLRLAAHELLSFLTALPADGFKVADDTVLPQVGEVNQFLAHAADRPDIAAASARVRAAEASVRAAQSGRNAMVGLSGDLYVLSDPGDAGDWNVSLTADLPIFDRGVRRGQVAEQRALARVSTLELAQVQRVAARDVRVAYADLVSALEQWSALESAVAVAKEAYEVQQKDYELGRASNLDTLTALSQLYELRQREAVLRMQVQASAIHLHVAAGDEVSP